MPQAERQLVLHRSLTRPNLLGGGERELVILLFTMVFALVFGAGIRPLSLLVGVIVYVGGHYGLIKAAQVDPYWFAIYRRSLTYRDWYPARSHIHAERKKRVPSVPV